jgi:hypothetical protein
MLLSEAMSFADFREVAQPSHGKLILEVLNLLVKDKVGICYVIRRVQVLEFYFYSAKNKNYNSCCLTGIKSEFFSFLCVGLCLHRM